MKTQWLFSHRFQRIGWVIFTCSFVVWIVGLYAHTLAVDTINHQIAGLFSTELGRFDADEILAIGFISGLLLIAFSREKVEDEMISQLRLEALQWSVYANYIVLMIAILTVYNTAFFGVLVYNMFTVLIIFLLRFRWSVYRLNQSSVL